MGPAYGPCTGITPYTGPVDFYGPRRASTVRTGPVSRRRTGRVPSYNIFPYILTK